MEKQIDTRNHYLQLHNVNLSIEAAEQVAFSGHIDHHRDRGFKSYRNPIRIKTLGPST